MKTALVLSYLGTRYHGWQRQKNALSVQEALETAIFKICGERVTLSGCGRTDAGVHAKIYAASCDLNTAIPLERLPLALNSALENDISVKHALEMPPKFDARFSCVHKEYTYLIYNSIVRSPFYYQRAYFCPQKIDIENMQKASVFLAGTHDFAALKNEGTPVKSTVRTIHYASAQEERGLISIKICADGFLYNMARSIAGTLLYCGSGKLMPQDIPEILKKGDRAAAGPTLPPEGLYLSKLHYGMEELDGRLEQG